MDTKLCLLVVLATIAFIAVEANEEKKSEDSNYKLVCYVSSWAYFRSGAGKFDVVDIKPNLCTHAIYAYAKLKNNRIHYNSRYLDLPSTFFIFKGHDGYGKFNDLKKQNPNLKTLISIGGKSLSNWKFSHMAANPAHRATFVHSVVEFLHKYRFDGLDIDWQYPVIKRGGRPEDKKNFVLLLQELKTALDSKGLLLTVAVSAKKSVIDSAYDIPEISKTVDLIHLQTYDFHGPSDRVTGFNAPLFANEHAPEKAKELTVDFAVNYWIEQGVDKEKLVMGLGSYGSSFTLAHPSHYGVGSKAAKPGRRGPWTQEEGILGYNEICKNLVSGGWAESFDSAAQAPYSYKGDQWVGYDNVKSIRIKVDYLMQKGLAGGMMWSLDTDDFKGLCYGKKFVLLSAAAEKLL